MCFITIVSVQCVIVIYGCFPPKNLVYARNPYTMWLVCLPGVYLVCLPGVYLVFLPGVYLVCLPGDYMVCLPGVYLVCLPGVYLVCLPGVSTWCLPGMSTWCLPGMSTWCCILAAFSSTVVTLVSSKLGICHHRPWKPNKHIGTISVTLTVLLISVQPACQLTR